LPEMARIVALVTRRNSSTGFFGPDIAAL